MRRFVVLALLGLLLPVWQEAFASEERLSFRRDAAGVSVVLSGLTGFCNSKPFLFANSVDRVGSLVTINSLKYGMGGGGCPADTPSGLPYEVVAGVGDLPPGHYTVTWTTSISASGPFESFLRADLVLADDTAARVPALSAWSLTLMLALVFGAGVRRLRLNGIRR